MFLRFLIFVGHCPPGLDHAIPTIARWRLASLPKYLSAEAIERVLAGCDRTTRIGVRDRAVLLLLARLGLRAGDVAALAVAMSDFVCAVESRGSSVGANPTRQLGRSSR
jgi:integrase/recombinase XerD